jgi:tetratricopeptide (TPR) repeat protein
MKKLIFCAAMIALGLWVTNPSQGQQKKMIPVTTGSEKALALYKEAMVAIEDVNINLFIDKVTQALKEDPGFFMANEQLAMYYIYYPVDKKFEEHAAKAISCKARLSKGEVLMKDALAKLAEKQDADVTEIGKKLVDLYPRDVIAYLRLSYYQYLSKDLKGSAETLKKALVFAEKPGFIYNQLGYTYLYLSQFDDARIALDKYIELEPNNPNAYDSKGDYYMSIKDYQKAYETFIKAYAINPTWGFAKAMNAKTLADSPLSDTETLAERKAIREAIEGEINASFSHDYAKWKEYFVQEPFTLWQQAAKDYPVYMKGWNDINSFMKPYMEKKSESKYTLNKCSGYIFRLYKDAALVSFTTSFTHESAGVKTEGIGREVRSLEKKDGKWKIVYLGTVYTSTWDK